MNLTSVTQATVTNSTVFVRVDYNVPLGKAADGSITVTDPSRVLQSLATLRWLTKQGAKVVLGSHLGRPQGPEDTHLSLRPVMQILEEHGFSVSFVPEVRGSLVSNAIQTLKQGQILLLENLRFDPGEKGVDSQLAQFYAHHCQIFVNEAFSVCHRKTATTQLLPQLIPAFAGLGLQKEVDALSRLTESIARPFIVVVGGAKISDKVGAVTHLADLADAVLVGGAVSNTFLQAQGLEVYRSFVEEVAVAKDTLSTKSYVSVAKKLLFEHRHETILKDNYIPLPKILAPIDVLAAPNKDVSDASQVREIPLHTGMQDSSESVQLSYFDIGPKTRRLYQELIGNAQTIFWNGPLGLWENPLFSEGTKAIGQAISQSSAYTVIGGGDTTAACSHFGYSSSFDYLSSGGGASLAFLAGQELPGLSVLKSKS